MKKTLLILIIIIGFITAVNAQIIIFEDDFESYDDFTITDFGDWTMHDLDSTATWGTPEARYPNQNYIGSAIIFNVNEVQDGDIPFDPTAGNYSIRDTGEKYASFWCAVGVTNNNYLISPEIDLSNVNSPTVSFWHKSLASAVNGFDPERFEVLLSTTGTEVDDFTVNLGSVIEISTCCSWNQFIFDLSPYVNNQVYIAIHHISSQDTYALHIDDFKVEATSVVGVNDHNPINFSFYPNPANNTLNIKASSTIKNIKIINTIGQVVATKKSNHLEESIDVSQLTTGVYCISVKIGDRIKNHTFLKK